MEQAYESVKKLVEDFRAHERDYLSLTYQESQVRQDFIDKFFTALGWDVTHERQKNPHEYEVQIENRVQIGGTQQRADYAFFLAPNFRDPKFYVEAKKPARQLENPDFLYQTMRYGWNGNTPIAILTDFEDLHVIDCRLKPTIKDALSRRIQSFHYTDYADEEKFVWIYYLFSHEAVADGSIEKFAAKLSKPKGKAARGVGKSQPVDEVFLAELDGYRESLAKAFKKSNQELQGEELTEAVQRTIDRLVFIRFLEDKLIEEKEIANLIDRQMAWELFVGYCKKLEPKYNGLIFKPHRIDEKVFNPPDEEVFQDICNGLAGQESPYNFAQIPISILGSIYERFLGKVVHATDKRVKVEEKPEVRKAGGVYYTPDYIVRYIVKETVGKLIDGKTPEEISKMAFADIACGSGSFLIEVYDLLLKYHERYYAEHPDKAKKNDLEQREGRKVLSLKKRQEILVNNIYGVDIDYQATEVTQLSLYLKLLEDVTTNDAYQFSLLKEKILPNLSKNIVCGNSLIGRDIVDGDLFPDVEESKLKPMNFEDAFPEVMHHGGFDAVVGNPPYGASFDDSSLKYLLNHGLSWQKSSESYSSFVLRAIQLLKQNGLISYIIPSAWAGAVRFRKFREKLLDQKVNQVIVLPFDVFEEAYIDTCLLLVEKGKTDLTHRVDTLVYLKKEKIKQIEIAPDRFNHILQEKWKDSESQKFVFEENTLEVVSRLYQVLKKLKDAIEIKRGVLFDKSLLVGKRLNSQYYQYFAGDIYRYEINEKFGGWIPFNDELKERPKELKWFTGERILLRRLVNRKQRMMAMVTSKQFITNKNLYSLCAIDKSLSLKFVLGVLNSKLISYLYIKQVTQAAKDDFPQVTIKDVLNLPLAFPDKTHHDHIVHLVERMLAAKEDLSKTKTEAETTRLERECEALDRQIDQAVYELYGLTEEEIKVVENV
ncbi:MAG: N-6 DNA methylase [Candidatus Kryptoniota bacterium]